MIKGVVFDLDGTLWNSVDLLASAWVETLKLMGYNVSKNDIKPLIGLNGREIARKVGGEDAASKFLQYLDSFDKYIISHFDEAPLFDDATETLSELRKRGIKIGLATSTPRRRLDVILDYYKIGQFFNVTVAGDEVLFSKPNPAIYLKAFNQLNINPKNGMIVGDTEYDVIPAKKIGALSVLIINNRNRGISEKSDFIVNRLNEVIGIIDSLGGLLHD
ncbi:MAG: HAD family hydrolase [Thermoprotei archaeon]